MPPDLALTAARDLLQGLVDDPTQNEAARIRQLVARLRAMLPEPDAGPMIDAFAAGTEVSLRTLPTAASTSTQGRADTLHGDAVVEFKRDVLADAALAQLELRRYIAATWSAHGVQAARLAVATDVVQWQIWTPRAARPDGPWTEADVQLEPAGLWDLTAADDNAATGLIDVVRRVVVQAPRFTLTAETIRRLFGRTSDVRRRGLAALRDLLGQRHNALDLSRELWTERARYGLASTDPDAAYATHAWLTLFSRVLVAATLSPGQHLTDEQLRGVVDGSTFELLLPGVERFVEHDLFGWMTEAPFVDALVPLARDQLRALARVDLSRTASEDVLGLLFAEVIPEDARLLLGQARTPRALAERVVEAALDGLPPDAPVLEAAVGSGSLLVALLRHRRAALEDQGHASQQVLQTLADSIVAMDVDPVAVVLAKANWVLCLRDLVQAAVAPVQLPVFHADALFVARRDADNGAELSFDDGRVCVPVPVSLLDDRTAFDGFVAFARERAALLAERGDPDASAVTPRWSQVLGQAFGPDLQADANALTDAARALVGALAQAILDDRDGVWAYVLRNRYGPTLLAGAFRAVVANPPWLTLSRLTDTPYLDELKDLSRRHGIAPQAESAHHLEVATPFLLHAVEHFLQPNGRFAFVMPWSVADAGHHDRFRRAMNASDLPAQLHALWDLRPVPDLFDVLACVMVGGTHSVSTPRLLTWSDLSSGPDHDEALELHERGDRSRWGAPVKGAFAQATYSVYPKRFAQGADLMPRTAVFVTPSGDLTRAVVPVQTDPREVANRNNKVLKDRSFAGRVASHLLWRTVTSNTLLPFVVTPDALLVVAMPFTLRGQHPVVVSDDELLDQGASSSQRFFASVDQAIRAAQPKGKLLRERLDVRGKLTKQRYVGAPLLVHMGAGGSKPCAALQVLDGSEVLPFAADQTTYVMRPRDAAEGHYVVGVINSQAMRDRIRDFQARGLFGERHVHKLPLHEIPPWDPTDATHRAIAAASQACATAAQAALTDAMQDTTRSLAARRKELQQAIAAPLADLEAAMKGLWA